MSNLHELTKQLDALTWNSRSVLNALVRSAMAAGSSDGFTVTRAGEKVTLGKLDIFAIYHFYEEWEADGYPSGDAFYALVSKHDSEYNGDAVVTQALMKHAQIMWMDSSNAGNKDNPTYWLDKIADTTNPKWLTNTAPIPLNVRTPIYDENLSTKTYDSYETYLFPSGYYSMDTLGYRGDGTSHSGGGKDWLFDVDDKFQVMAKHALFGIQNADALSLYKDSYNMEHEPGFAFEGGEDCFALADNSMSYGISNVSAGKNSVILGGQNNSIYRDKIDSGILAGVMNDVVENMSAVCGGNKNSIAGSSSFATNTSNHVGGYPYSFQRSVEIDGSETECDKEYTAPNGCLYTLATTGTATSSDGAIQLSASQIYIPDTERQAAIISNNRISVCDRKAPYSPFDFKVGDTVVLYDFTVRGDDGNDVSLGHAVMGAEVTGIDPVSEQQAGEGTGSGIVGYIISLNQNVTVNNIPDIGLRAVKGGRICRTSAVDYNFVDSTGGRVLYVDTFESRDNAVFGYNNIAGGESQTVVGSSNYELLKPRFIVGSGTSYIQQSNAESLSRDVSFVSAPYYTYQKSTHYIVSGVASYTTGYILGDMTRLDTEENRRYDEDYEALGVEKYRGFYAYSINQNPETMDFNAGTDTRAVLRVHHESSLLAISDKDRGSSGIKIREKAQGQDNSVLNELYSSNGSISIHSEDDDTEFDWLGYHKTYADQGSTLAERAITVWAKGLAGIHGSYIRLDSDIGLIITGPTRNALTAQPGDFGLEPYDINDEATNVEMVTGTGHYYIDKQKTGWTASDTDFGRLYSNGTFSALHIIESSKNLGNGTYEVAQLMIPGNLNANCSRTLRSTSGIPHPALCVTQVTSSSSSRTTGTNMIAEELAYLSDIQIGGGAVVCPNKGVLGYMQNVFEGEWAYADGLNEVSYAGNGYYVLDTFLSAMADGSTPEYASASDPQVINTTNKQVGQIVHVNSFSNAAASSARVYTDSRATKNKPFYLNGVMLNPMMYMTARDRTENKIKGVAYLAYGPTTINCPAISQTGDTQRTVYTQQLEYVTPDPQYSQNLSTSGYCTGSSSGSIPNNLRDVWATLLYQPDEEVQEYSLYWMKLLQDFHVTYAGGRLSVEFQLSGFALSHGLYLPAMPVTTGTYSKGYVRPSISMGDSKKLKGYNLLLNLPIDPSIGNNLANAANGGTGVMSQMYGQICHQSSALVYADVTGFYNTLQSMPVYDLADQPVYKMGYAAPQVQIIIKVNDDNLNDQAWYQCHLEGVVSYVN